MVIYCDSGKRDVQGRPGRLDAAPERHTWLYMCGRVVQVSDPIRLSIVDGLGVRETRLSNYPRRWNAAPSQELLVIRENHNTGERSLDLLKWGLSHPLLVRRSEGRAEADQRQIGNRRDASDVQGRLSTASMHPPRRRLL